MITPKKLVNKNIKPVEVKSQYDWKKQRFGWEHIKYGTYAETGIQTSSRPYQDYISDKRIGGMVLPDDTNSDHVND